MSGRVKEKDMLLETESRATRRALSIRGSRFMNVKDHFTSGERSGIYHRTIVKFSLLLRDHDSSIA